MHTSLLVTTLLTLTTKVLSQDPYYSTQSPPFNLVIASKNSTLNGSLLYACHEGAAIEGLCIGSPAAFDNSTSAIYNHNYSSQSTPDPITGPVGLLTWVLHGGNFNLSSPMQLSTNPTSNVAVPLFQPSDSGTMVGFDKDEKMFIPGYLSDTVTPPVYKTQKYYRWFVCLTNAGYTYTTLAWVYGVHAHPQNPSCQAVDVVRRFL